MSYESWIAAHARVASKKHTRLKLDDLMSFFQQLATLVAAGVPLLQALQITSQQAESRKLRQVLEEIEAGIAAGNSFHACAANYPHVFEYAWVEMIRTGEITGKMGYVLIELNKQIRESRETRRKIKGAMMYPVVLLCISTLAITAMLWFVVPTFTKMFEEMGAELPQITQIVVNISKGVSAYGHYTLAGVIAAIIAMKKYMNTEHGRRTVGGFLLVVPTVGDMLVQMMMYRFASSLALLLKSGVPMLETMETLRGIFGHSPLYRDALAHVQFRIASGHSLAGSLEETGLFTTMIVNTVRTGEESGQLANVMEQIAPYYKEKAETMIARVSKMLEPIIIVGMGTGVAFMMLSIYMPMFEMSGKVK
jgi:type IV pilus assembly protein PilC